jgi:hypothetical protein
MDWKDNSVAKVKLYWSYTQFPELSQYNRGEKTLIWSHFCSWQGGKESKSMGRFFPVIVVVSGILGAFIGALNSADLHRGSSWGFGLGLVAAVPLAYLEYVFWLNTRRKALQRFLQSEDFKGVPTPEEMEEMLGLARFEPSPLVPVPPVRKQRVALRGDDMIMDLQWDVNALPLPRLLALVFSLAVSDRAEKLVFELSDSSSEEGVRMSYVAKGTVHVLAPAAGCLFDPMVTVLCNHASLDYYTRGPVNGKVQTKNPASTWRLESDDLKKHVVLWRENT